MCAFLAKLVPVGFGIKKLQIMCVVEDEKVSVEELQEKIEAFEDFVIKFAYFYSIYINNLTNLSFFRCKASISLPSTRFNKCAMKHAIYAMRRLVDDLGLFG